MAVAEKKMTGKELYDFYTSKRDYSESEEDTYAQLLNTIEFQLNPANNKNQLYELLEKAEELNKKLTLIDISENGTKMRNELTINDIIFI